MRKTLKIAVAFTIALGLRAAMSQAQPLITGNTAAYGCGPIVTSDFSLGTVTHQFFPDGAGTGCPHDFPPYLNGRGLAIGGNEVFYTELDEIPAPPPFQGYGPSEFIHVANFNAGVGSGDTRLLVNPRPGSGIQDLTFSNGILYALTGYDTQVPIVFKLNLQTGAVLPPTAGVTVPRVGFTDDSVDGFAVLPNGNFLMNNMGTSCIYAEYDKTDGHFIGNIINVPGGPARCSGVDTDGTSLYFLTDLTGITRTDFSGNMTGFNFFDGPGAEDFIEDISLVHPVTTITDVADGHLWLGLANSDDQGTEFDLKVELLLNGNPVSGATALTRCIINLTRNPSLAEDVVASFPAFPSQLLVSGDVVGFRFSTRIGTNPDDTKCDGPGGAHASAVGMKMYYDSGNRASYIPITIQPNPEQQYYLHSDGGACPGGSSAGSPGVTTQFLDTTAPGGSTPKCGVSGGVSMVGGNLFSLIGTWSLAPLP